MIIHTSACHVLSSHHARLLPNLRLATCECQALLPRTAFLQTLALFILRSHYGCFLRSLRLPCVAFPSGACPSKLPRAPATFPSQMFPSETSPCHVGLHCFHAVVPLTLQVAASGLQKQNAIKYKSCGLQVLYGFLVLWFLVFDWVDCFVSQRRSH